MSWRNYLPSPSFVNNVLRPAAILFVSYGIVESMGALLPSEDAAKWSQECQSAVTELGFCLLQGMLPLGLGLNPDGADYDCGPQTDDARAQRHGVSPSELAGCVGLMANTRAGKYGQPYTQECLRYGDQEFCFNQRPFK